MGKVVSTKVAVVSMVLVGLILAAAHEAHATRPEKPDVAVHVADGEPAVKAGDVRRELKMQEANPYSRGCTAKTKCRG